MGTIQGAEIEGIESPNALVAFAAIIWNNQMTTR